MRVSRKSSRECTAFNDISVLNGAAWTNEMAFFNSIPGTAGMNETAKVKPIKGWDGTAWMDETAFLNNGTGTAWRNEMAGAAWVE